MLPIRSRVITRFRLCFILSRPHKAQLLHTSVISKHPFPTQYITIVQLTSLTKLEGQIQVTDILIFRETAALITIETYSIMRIPRQSQTWQHATAIIFYNDKTNRDLIKHYYFTHRSSVGTCFQPKTNVCQELMSCNPTNIKKKFKWSHTFLIKSKLIL